MEGKNKKFNTQEVFSNFTSTYITEVEAEEIETRLKEFFSLLLKWEKEQKKANTN